MATRAKKDAGQSKRAAKKTPPAANLEGKKKARPLTIKQKKLVKGVVAGKTQKQAAIDAGYSPKHAESAASHELNKAQVKATLQSLMAKHGLDDASLLKVHADMIQATKVVSAVGGKDADSKTMDFIDVPDWQARGKGLEMAYKLAGAFVEKKEHTFPEGFALEVVFGDD
jgi:hypothetical protein